MDDILHLLKYGIIIFVLQMGKQALWGQVTCPGESDWRLELQTIMHTAIVCTRAAASRQKAKEGLTWSPSQTVSNMGCLPRLTTKTQLGPESTTLSSLRSSIRGASRGGRHSSRSSARSATYLRELTLQWGRHYKGRSTRRKTKHPECWKPTFTR